MKASDTNTFTGALATDEYARRFRNQATGIGQCRAASEQTGAIRAQVAIDCAPPAQLAVADRSYPKPAPVLDPATGNYLDKGTGKKYKPEPSGLGGIVKQTIY